MESARWSPGYRYLASNKVAVEDESTKDETNLAAFQQKEQPAIHEEDQFSSIEMSAL